MKCLLQTLNWWRRTIRNDMTISANKLKDFFRYYDDSNGSHTASVELLHEDLTTSAPRLLEESTSWIKKYREAPPKSEALLSNPLNVPYDCQLDNPGMEGWRECFSSSCAMVAMYWGVIEHQNEYHHVRPRFGDSTEPTSQIRTLNHFGLNAEFKMMGSKEKLIAQIDKGRPAPVGFLHHGSPQNPTGGGHYVCCIGYDDTSFIFNDPYGELDVVAGGYARTGGTYGKGIHYSYKNWVPRWSVANDNDGWGLDVWK